MTARNHNQYQGDFDQLVNQQGVSAALHWFHQQQVRDNFVDPSKLAQNTLFQQYSDLYQLTFEILINRVRDAYAKQVVDAPADIKKYCPLCVEHIDAIGQVKKQYVHIDLLGRRYYVSLTPFPSFQQHFVISLAQHQPMVMQPETIAMMIALQHRIGANYSIVCNSDHKKTGASILDHHHMQLLDVTTLPVAAATALESRMLELDGHAVIMERLHYPAAVVRMRSTSDKALAIEAGNFLQAWRALENGNTCNLWSRKIEDEFELYIILRHPRHETNPALFRYKTEGIGIIEMCGYGIFPVPKANAELVLDEIQQNAAVFMADLLKCHAPEFSLDDLNL